MIQSLSTFLFDLLVFLPLFIISVTCHEFAHAWTANRFGDPTAREAGRLTLNPLRHIDPLGTLLLILVHFGWAKPVPVDPGRMRRPRLQMPLVAAAGPAANLLLALAGLQAFHLLAPARGSWTYLLLGIFVWLNVMLLVFNLLPIPPLDGSSFLRSLLPAGLLHHYDRLVPWGVLVLFLAFNAPPVRLAFGGAVELVLHALERLVI